MGDSAEPSPGADLRAADEALVEALHREGFQGPAWEHFTEDLAGYGHQIVKAWIASLRIFLKCSEKGVRCPGSPQGSRRLSEDDANEMANEIVARAINAFRDKVLRPGRWSPQGGASLTTMFITQCLFQFPNVYRRWRLEAKPLPVANNLEQLDSLETGPEGDPAGLVMIHEEIAHALDHFVKDERVRNVLIYQAMGYTRKQSAEMIGTTVKALDSALQRHWKTVNLKRRDPGGKEGETVR